MNMKILSKANSLAAVGRKLHRAYHRLILKAIKSEKWQLIRQASD